MDLKLKIQRLIEIARETNSSSLLIQQNSMLLCEEYFNNDTTPVPLRSITKSVVSLAVGLLVDHGHIESVDTPISTYFPSFRSPDKDAITLKHVLTHTSGIQSPNPKDIEQVESTMELAFQSPVIETPGTIFRYNNLAVYVISALVELLTNTTLDEYIAENLFSCLEIEEFQWHRDHRGTTHCMAGLSLRGRDLLKLGQLVLNEGSWNGHQVISSRWIRESTQKIQGVDPLRGYLWWLKDDDQNSLTTEASGSIRYVSSDGSFCQKLCFE